MLGDEIETTPIIILSPAGERFTQSLAADLARHPRLALICGRYEGIDERATEILGARELSIGDYVMTGGELAAAVVVDVVARLVPGVIDEASLRDESHTSGLLEHPHYTRPAEYRGLAVPEILLSGHHARIAEWRREQAIKRTKERRPDLLERATLSDAERRRIADGGDQDEPGARV